MTRTLLTMLAAVALVCSASGCPHIGNDLGGVCHAGEPCVCEGIGNCEYSCPTGGCSFTCQGIGNCDFSCAGGGCELTCRNTGNCTMSCPGPDCSIHCMGMGNCTLDSCTACMPDAAPQPQPGAAAPTDRAPADSALAADRRDASALITDASPAE